MNTETTISAWRRVATQRWQSLAERERVMVAVAGAVLAVSLLWWVGLAPALRSLREAPAQIEALDMQLQEMRRLAAETRDLRALPAIAPAQAQAALAAAAQRLGDKARLSPQGERAVLQVTHLSGEQLGAWLAEARVSARARVVEAQLVRTPQGDYAGSLVLALGVRP